MVSIDDYMRLTLEDKPLFEEHFQKFPPPHSDYLFTTLISWMHYADYCFTFVDDKLLLMSNANDKKQFRPPLGKFDKNLTKKVLKLAHVEGGDRPFGLVTPELKELLLTSFPNLKFSADRDFFDYVYRASDLSDLPGKNYVKIRNKLNKFIKSYNYTLELISNDNIDEVNKFLNRWCLWRDCVSVPMLEYEKKAILFSMRHFFELDISGLALRVDGEIEAISVFEKISSDTAVVHYEKGISDDFPGIYQVINMEVAKFLQKEFRYVNREPDMGISGLRQAKMSYRPHHFVKVFHVERDDDFMY